MSSVEQLESRFERFERAWDEVARAAIRLLIVLDCELRVDKAQLARFERSMAQACEEISLISAAPGEE